eukprot:scaffold5220_cov147-Isochrysis_galbana.AAC.3
MDPALGHERVPHALLHLGLLSQPLHRRSTWPIVRRGRRGRLSRETAAAHRGQPRASAHSAFPSDSRPEHPQHGRRPAMSHHARRTLLRVRC